MRGNELNNHRHEGGLPGKAHESYRLNHLVKVDRCLHRHDRSYHHESNRVLKLYQYRLAYDQEMAADFAHQ